MSQKRRAIALIILCIIVIGQLFDILLQREDWPFSNYPMYARLIKHRETSLLRLYGRVTDGQKQWIMPIVDDNNVMYVPPINEMRMKNILEFAWNRSGEKATQHVLRDYMAMYEERRILGTQGTPQPGPRMLEAICMRLTWKLNAGAAASKPRLDVLTTASAFPPAPAIAAATQPAAVVRGGGVPKVATPAAAEDSP